MLRASIQTGGSFITALSSTTTLGDSTIATYNVAQGAVISGWYTPSFIGYINDALQVGGGAGFDVTSVRAVQGKTWAEVITEQLPGALTDTTEVAYIQCGVNDFQTSGTGVGVQTILDNARIVITALAAAKKAVIVNAVNPVSQAWAGVGAAKSRVAEFAGYNAALAVICGSFRNVIFVDTASAILDPTSLNLEPVVNKTNDGLHQNSGGGFDIANGSIDTLRQKLVLTKYKTVGANLMPAFTGTGGTRSAAANSFGVFAGSGNPPASYDLSRILAGSSASACTVSTLGPNHIRFTFANTAAGVTFQLSVEPTAMSAITAQLASGDTIQAGFGFQATGNVLLKEVAAQLVNGTDNHYAGVFNSAVETQTAGSCVAKSHGGVRLTPPYTFSGAPNAAFAFNILVQLGATTGASVIDLYTPTLFKLT